MNFRLEMLPNLNYLFSPPQKAIEFPNLVIQIKESHLLIHSSLCLMYVHPLLVPPFPAKQFEQNQHINTPNGFKLQLQTQSKGF
jgi:hypothetical protein